MFFQSCYIIFTLGFNATKLHILFMAKHLEMEHKILILDMELKGHIIYRECSICITFSQYVTKAMFLKRVHVYFLKFADWLFNVYGVLSRPTFRSVCTYFLSVDKIESYFVNSFWYFIASKDWKCKMHLKSLMSALHFSYLRFVDTQKAALQFI